MAQASSRGTAVPLVAAGVGGAYVFRTVRQLRCRATNPDVPDPARNLMRWLQGLATVVALVIAAATVALIWSIGPAGIIFAIPFALLLVLLGVTGALFLWAYAEAQRRKGGYMICEIHYPDAPRQVKANMRRIYRAGRSVKSGAAYRGGVFGKLEIDRLVYSAADRAVASSQLSAAIRDLRPNARVEDRAVLEKANAQIKEITDYLAEVEQALGQSAATAKGLSDRLDVPSRPEAQQRVVTAQAVARDDRRQRARERLDDVQRRVQSFDDGGLHDVTERIAAVDQGHREASEVSKKVFAPDLSREIGGPQSREAESVDSGADTELARDAVLRAAAASAGRVRRLSPTAAKASLRKLRQRNQ